MVKLCGLRKIGLMLFEVIFVIFGVFEGYFKGRVYVVVYFMILYFMILIVLLGFIGIVGLLNKYTNICTNIFFKLNQNSKLVAF